MNYYWLLNKCNVLFVICENYQRTKQPMKIFIFCRKGFQLLAKYVYKSNHAKFVH